MGDTFDELWDSTPAAPVPTGELSFDALWDATPATPTGLNPASAQVGKGLTFGYFDEIQGAEAGLQNLVKSIFGLGNNQSFSENYGAKVKELRAVDSAYEKANPVKSVALQMAGAAAPAVVSGGTSAAVGGAELAPGALSSLMRTIFGVGIKEAPTAAQLVKMGAAQGALAGSGEANDGDRLAGAGVGAGVGAIAAPIVGKTLEKGTNVVTDYLANKGIIGVPGVAATGGERGSFSNLPTGTSYTPEEVFVAKQLKNTPLEKVVQGANELAETSSSDIPLFLPEAVNSPKVDRNARFIANYDPSLEFSQSAISGRTAGAEERAVKLLDAVSPENSPFDGATKMRNAAADIISGAESERSRQVAPIYSAAYKETPVIKDQALDTLMEKDQVLRDAISSIKKSAINADLPDNSTELLVKARQEISNLIEGAQAQGRGRKARDLQDTYSRLNNILHGNSDTLRLADETYGAMSRDIENLTDSTFIKSLSKMSDDKIQNIGQIFDKPAEQITALRKQFADAGKLDEWNAGIRSHLQSTVESTSEGRNFADKLTGTTLAKSKLEAALGDSYDKVLQGLEYESRFAKGKNKYHTGSTTASNIDENKRFKETAGFIKNLFSGNFKEAFGTLFNSDMPDELAQQVAKIYFDPKRGSDALEKIIPLLKQYAANSRISGEVGKSSGNLTARDLASRAESQILNPQSDLGSSPASRVSPSLDSKVNATFQNYSPEAGQATQSLKSEPQSKSISQSSSDNTPTSSLLKTVFGPSRGIVDEMFGSGEMARSPEFDNRAIEVADNLGIDPEHLFKVIGFETGGTFDSKVKNAAGSGATGLLQFMPPTAKDLTKADTEKAAIRLLESLTPTEQLDYVEKYLKPFKGKIKTLDDLYMAVLWPAAIGKDSNYALFREGTKAFAQNKGLDINDDGIITKAEAASKVRSYEA